MQADSLIMQEQTLREYAAQHGHAVVSAYADSASGRTEDREACAPLIATVRRASRFDAILVLDVSRWGRFDDPDRAAYGMGALIGALAGVNVISGAGMLDFLLTQSLEKLLLDHEACGMALRVIRGIQEDESDSLALIAEVVRAGEFLSHEHTRRNWRRELARVARDRSRQLRRLGNGRRNAGR